MFVTVTFKLATRLCTRNQNVGLDTVDEHNKLKKLEKSGILWSIKHERWQRLTGILSVMASLPLWKIVLVLEVRFVNDSLARSDWRPVGKCSDLSCWWLCNLREVTAQECVEILKGHDVCKVCLDFKLCLKTHTYENVTTKGWSGMSEMILPYMTIWSLPCITVHKRWLWRCQT